MAGVKLRGSFFIDTSTLLSGTIEFGESSRASQAVMRDIAEGRLRDVHTAWHCCLEFYSVATRLPEEFRLSPEQCLRLMESEILSRFEIHQLRSANRRSFLEDAVAERVAGGRIYDAQIGEVARQTGARIVVTENVRHFSALRRHGIQVLPASELGAA